MRVATKAGLVCMIASSLLTSAVPAAAQRRSGWDNRRPDWSHGRRHDRNDKAVAGAVLGGILGLGIGAAIASSNNDRDRYRDPPRYRDGSNGYYAGPAESDPWGSPSGYAVGGVVDQGRGNYPYR